MVMFLVLRPVGSVSLNSFVLLERLAVLLTSTLAVGCWLGDFLDKAIGIIDFLEFCGRCCGLVSGFQVGLGSLLRRGLSEPGFCGDLVCGLGRIVDSGGFSAQFIKIISHCGGIGYDIDVLQQTACLVVGPVTVGGFAFLFNCTPVGRTSDSVVVPT